MNRARRAEVKAITNDRVAFIVECTFDGCRDPFFEDPEEQALAEAEVRAIARRIGKRGSP